MDIQVDFTKRQPIYRQICECILSLIHSGQLQHDDQLPTVRVLASMLGVNFNTVARAYRLLDSEGWITTQQGRGTYILRRERTDPQTGSQTPDQQHGAEWLLDNLLKVAELHNISIEEIYRALELRVRGNRTEGSLQPQKPAPHHMQKKKIKRKTKRPGQPVANAAANAAANTPANARAVEIDRAKIAREKSNKLKRRQHSASRR